MAGIISDTRRKECRCNLIAIIVLLITTHGDALRSQSESPVLVRPVPTHLAVIIAGGCTQFPAFLGSIAAIEMGGESGFGLWHLLPPPGLTSPLVLSNCLGSSLSDGGLAGLLGVFANLDIGHQLGLYQIINPEKVTPLADFLLEQIRDRKEIVEDDYGAYLQAIRQSGRCDFSGFWRAGESNLRLTRADLMNRPGAARGLVIRGEGVVRRLRRLKPLQSAIVAGVPELFEAWIFQDIYGANPICVVTSRLSAGLAPAENLQKSVRFAGYFFKVYQYRPAQTRLGKAFERECPLLIGPELMAMEGTKNVSQDRDEWPKDLLGLMLGIFVGSCTLIWGLTWWLGRGDSQVRRRLQTLKGKEKLFFFHENLNQHFQKQIPEGEALAVSDPYNKLAD